MKRYAYLKIGWGAHQTDQYIVDSHENKVLWSSYNETFSYRKNSLIAFYVRKGRNFFNENVKNDRLLEVRYSDSLEELQQQVFVDIL